MPAGKYFDLAEEPSAKQIPDGVVMVSIGDGCVEEWSNNGTFLKTICGGFADAGSGFDPAANFYLTLFSEQQVAKFDPTGLFLGFGPAAAYYYDESIERDDSGKFYVGNASDYDLPADPACTPSATNSCYGSYCDSTSPYQCYSRCYQPQDGNDGKTYPNCPLLVFDSTFTSLLHAWYPDTEKAPAGKEQAIGRGTDWGAILRDPDPKKECTMRYTSEGTTVKQFDICSGTQMADFATG